MGYINEYYGERNRDFVNGFIEAMYTYAWWKDGKQWIGSPEKELREEQRRAIRELGHDPKDFE